MRGRSVSTYIGEKKDELKNTWAIGSLGTFR